MYERRFTISLRISQENYDFMKSESKRLDINQSDFLALMIGFMRENPIVSVQLVPKMSVLDEDPEERSKP